MNRCLFKIAKMENIDPNIPTKSFADLDLLEACLDDSSDSNT